jgi:hypothetical protein
MVDDTKVDDMSCLFFDVFGRKVVPSFHDLFGDDT